MYKSTQTGAREHEITGDDFRMNMRVANTDNGWLIIYKEEAYALILSQAYQYFIFFWRVET